MLVPEWGRRKAYAPDVLDVQSDSVLFRWSNMLETGEGRAVDILGSSALTVRRGS